LSSEIHAATLQSPSLHSPYRIEQSEIEARTSFYPFIGLSTARSDIRFANSLGFYDA
jgi:hypothetical protein